jgi:hypothetical protein
MNWSIDFAPLVPWSVLWAAAAIALLLCGLLLWQRSRGALVRAISLTALLAALANPTLKAEERRGLTNIAVVAVDRSASQALGTRTARTQAVLETLQAKLATIPNLEVRTVDAGSNTTGVAGTERDGTEMFGDIARAMSDVPAERLAGLMLITDGNVHDIPKSAAALGFDAPVHALLTGAQGEFDRRIEVLKAPRYGLVGTETTAQIKVQSSVDSGAGRVPAQLVIKRDGEPDLGVTAAVDEVVDIPISFAKSGANIVEIVLAPVPNELTEANNRMILQAEGVRENLRVLLVSGEPHAGERTWRNLLKSDAAVDLVHFTILRPPQKQDSTPINELSLIAFPTRELFSEKIEEFDLIIFDRYESKGILPAIYIDNISRFVEEHGGAVLVAAGAEYAGEGSLYNTPLAQILPAAPTGRSIDGPYRPLPTIDGRRHPVTAGLPGIGTGTGAQGAPGWGRWFRTVEVTAPSGRVLMTGAEDKPLLVLDRKGKGRVALLLSDHAWLWARGLDGGGPHTQLLRRIGHWLMKEPELEEERLTASGRGLSLTIERRSMADAVPAVGLTAPSGNRTEHTLQPVSPGLWRATVPVTEPGFYKLAQGDLTTVALAGNRNSREMSEVTTTAKPLSALLAATGGGAFWTAASPSAAATAVTVPRISLMSSGRILSGSDWMGLKIRDAFVVTGITLLPLATGFAALGILLGLMTMAWWREGR